jgi:hypothetical protein
MRACLFKKTPGRGHRAESNTDQNQIQSRIKRGESQQRLNHKGTKDTKQKQAKFVAICLVSAEILRHFCGANAETRRILNHQDTKGTKQEQAKFAASWIADWGRSRF